MSGLFSFILLSYLVSTTSDDELSCERKTLTFIGTTIFPIPVRTGITFAESYPTLYLYTSSLWILEGHSLFLQSSDRSVVLNVWKVFLHQYLSRNNSYPTYSPVHSPTLRWRHYSEPDRSGTSSLMSDGVFTPTLDYLYLNLRVDCFIHLTI